MALTSIKLKLLLIIMVFVVVILGGLKLYTAYEHRTEYNRKKATCDISRISTREDLVSDNSCPNGARYPQSK